MFVKTRGATGLCYRLKALQGALTMDMVGTQLQGRVCSIDSSPNPCTHPHGVCVSHGVLCLLLLLHDFALHNRVVIKDKGAEAAGKQTHTSGPEVTAARVRKTFSGACLSKASAEEADTSSMCQAWNLLKTLWLTLFRDDACLSYGHINH